MRKQSHGGKEKDGLSTRESVKERQFCELDSQESYRKNERKKEKKRLSERKTLGTFSSERI